LPLQTETEYDVGISVVFKLTIKLLEVNVILSIRYASTWELSNCFDKSTRYYNTSYAGTPGSAI
jgi:hypothetical protein